MLEPRFSVLFVVLVFLTIPFVGVAADYSDEFTAGVDPFYWTIESSQPLFTMDDTGGQVCFSKPSGGSGGALDIMLLSFNCEIIGDFEATANFADADIDFINGSYGNQIALQTIFGPQSVLVARSDDSSGENAHVWLDPQWTINGWIENSDPAGTFRIVRQGSLVSAYLNDLMLHSVELNGKPVTTLHLLLQNNHTTDSVSVCFDNFDLTADELVCNDVNWGLVSDYPFNGSPDDASGNDNHGTVHGPVLSEDRWGNAHSAYFFDGTDDYVSAPRSDSLDIDGALSMSAWINAVTFPAGNTWTAVIDKEDTSQGYNLHVRDDQKLHVRIDNTWVNAGHVMTGRWRHLVGVFDGVFIKTYVDGVEVGRTTQFMPTYAAPKDLFIGSWYFDRFFHGTIDDVRIYDRSLSGYEITGMSRERPIFNDGFEGGDTSMWSATVP